MLCERILVQSIPTLIWGKPSRTAYIYGHGKLWKKEEAEAFAEIAQRHGHQTISFDLPQHGERIGEEYPCSVWNGVEDFSKIAEFSRSSWEELSFFGCSLGAYFGLMAFQDLRLQKCLFYSPLVDMKHMIVNMLKALGLTEHDLYLRREIPTPFGETLSWPYLEYVQKHPIEKWKHKTSILSGSKDDLVDPETVIPFCERFQCRETVVEGAGHYFQDPEHLRTLYAWIESEI